MTSGVPVYDTIEEHGHEVHVFKGWEQITPYHYRRTFGAVTLVFQEGHGARLFGVTEPLGAVFRLPPQVVKMIESIWGRFELNDAAKARFSEATNFAWGAVQGVGKVLASTSAWPRWAARASSRSTGSCVDVGRRHGQQLRPHHCPGRQRRRGVGGGQQQRRQRQRLLRPRQGVDHFLEDQRHTDVGHLGGDHEAKRGNDAPLVFPEVGKEPLEGVQVRPGGGDGFASNGAGHVHDVWGSSRTHEAQSNQLLIF